MRFMHFSIRRLDDRTADMLRCGEMSIWAKMKGAQGAPRYVVPVYLKVDGYPSLTNECRFLPADSLIGVVS